MVGHVLKLPIGYWHNDTFYKKIILGPITGFTEEKVYNKIKSNAYHITQLLTGCVQQVGPIKKITPELIRDLSIRDRDFLVFKLRELTFGSKIECTLKCPINECSKNMNINFDTNALAAEKRELASSYFNIEREGNTITFRLPNGDDQEAVAELTIKDPSSVDTAIFRRCITSINKKQPSDSEIDNLSQKTKEAIMKKMEEVDPYTDLNMQVVCPECGNKFLAPFDIQDFFIHELNLNPDVFYREIHYLAYYYHWTEEKILALPREKRKMYVAMVMDELSRANE